MMHDVQINHRKNRLYITLGDLDYANIETYVSKIKKACKCLVPGFTCLTVLKRKGAVRQNENDLLFNTTDLVYAYGASKIAHVKNNNDRLDFHPPGTMGLQFYFPVVKAKNRQEAEALLDGEKTGWS
jgi:hypothetical protein